MVYGEGATVYSVVFFLLKSALGASKVTPPSFCRAPLAGSAMRAAGFLPFFGKISRRRFSASLPPDIAALPFSKFFAASKSFAAFRHGFHFSAFQVLLQHRR